MHLGKEGRIGPLKRTPASRKLSQIEQLKSDLAGLEQLHALQGTLLREIRRQVEEIQVKSAG